MVDHVISQIPSPPARHTREEQRTATRQAILDATVDCLAEDGYGWLTTRRVAERAGVAQSTVMHHFATREALLIEAVTQVAAGLADQVVGRIDLAALRDPAHREAVLDETWREFTSPQALAAGQLWLAVGTDAALAPMLRELEGRINRIILVTAGALFADRLADDPRLPALLDGSLALIRGLVVAIPVWGAEEVTARWEAIKPLVLDAAAYLLDGRS